MNALKKTSLWRRAALGLGLIPACALTVHAEDIDLSVDPTASQANVAILDTLTAEEIDSATSILSGAIPATRDAGSWVFSALDLRGEDFSLTLADGETTIQLTQIALSLPEDLVGVGLRAQEVAGESGTVVAFDSVLCSCDDFRAELSFNARIPVGNIFVNLHSDALFEEPLEFDQPLQLLIEDNGQFSLSPTEPLQLDYTLDLSLFNLGTVDLLADVDLRLVPEPDHASLVLTALGTLALLARKRSRSDR